MRDTLRRLIELETLDAELAARELEQGEMPARHAELDAQEAAGRERVEAARAAIAGAEARQRELEAELADAEATLGRLDQQQYEVTSRDAYQALLHEMSAAKQSISTHESEILELMERVESGRAELHGLEESVAREQAQIAAARRALEARASELRGETARLGTERDGLTPQIEPSALDRYQRIAKRHRPAVVKLQGEVCPACRVGIPPQLLLQLLEGKTLIACNSCQRLLVHERLLEGAPEGA